jgi:RimJ/RimL family protein N-acetyltransferase
MAGATFLRGERVELRTVEREHAEFLRDLVNDPEVWQYLDNRPPLNGVAEEEWIEEQAASEDSVDLLISVDGEPAGTIGFRPATPVDGSVEVGLMLAPAFWGEGHGTDAARALTTYAFEERRAHRVMAKAITENVGSCRIWETLGFREEGVFREAAFHGGEYLDLAQYAVLADEWDHYDRPVR